MNLRYDFVNMPVDNNEILKCLKAINFINTLKLFNPTLLCIMLF